MSADPFLAQKLEFLTLELQESKEREQKLKQTYDSLLSLINSPAYSEQALPKPSQTEVEEVRFQAKQDRDRLELECREWQKRVHTLELDLKEAKAMAERERMELRAEIARLLADKQAWEYHQRSVAEEKARQPSKSDLDRRLQALSQQFEAYKEAAERDKERILTQAEAQLRDASNAYGKEKADLMRIISEAEGKAVEQREKLASLRSEYEGMKTDLATARLENESLRKPVRHYKDKVEEEKQRLLTQVQSLQGKILSFRHTPRTKTAREERPASEVAVLRAQLAKAEKTVETLKIELNEERRKQQISPKTVERAFQVSNSMSTLKQSRDDGFLSDRLREQLVEAGQKCEDLSEQLRASQIESKQLQLQKERLQVEMDRANVETKQLQLDWSEERRQLQDEVKKMKAELKYYIGKLVKVKGKLAVECEMTETLRKEGVLDVSRSRSVSKVRSHRGVSPLNLSAIARAESPCLTQSIDVM